MPGLDASRRRSETTGGYSSSHSLGVDLRYEVDLWGKLSDNERQANLAYLAAEATFEQARQQLVSDVVDLYFSIVGSGQLVALYEQRVANSRQNLEIIEAGYRGASTVPWMSI